MAIIEFKLTAENPADFEETMRYFGRLVAPPTSDKPLSTTSSATDHRYMHSSELELVQQSYYKDGFNAGYKKGSGDATAEAAQERVMSGNNKLAAMLEHNEVMVCLEPNRAPFAFMPLCMTKFRDVPNVALARAVPNYQRELIGTPAECVGMYGFNVLTQRHIFFVRCDHWTLCPPLDNQTKPV